MANKSSETLEKTELPKVGDWVNYRLENGKDRACQATHTFENSETLRLLFFSSPIPHAPNDEPTKGHWHFMKEGE